MATRGLKRAPENDAQTKELLKNAFKKQVTALENFSGLIDKTWQLHRSSPLHKFSTEEEFLKNAMKDFIKSVKSNLGSTKLDQKQIYGYFAPMHKTEESQPYLSVTVLVGTSGRSASRLLVVMCPGAAESEEFACYPLLLMKGPALLSTLFLNWLASSFDSYITSISFSPVELGNLAFLWMLQENERPLELEYSLPASVSELKHITVTLQPDTVRQLLEAVDGREPEAPPEIKALRVMETVHVHFDAAFRVNLNALSLTKLTTSMGVIAAEGRVKILSGTHVEVILETLTALQLMRAQAKQ